MYQLFYYLQINVFKKVIEWTSIRKQAQGRKKVTFCNIQNSKKWQLNEFQSNWLWELFEFYICAQAAGITTQFIGLQLCCGYQLRIQKWIVYAKQLQPRKPGTCHHFSIWILEVLHHELANVTEQMRPRFQTKTNLEGPKETEAETSSPMLLVAKDFVESTQFLLPIQKGILGRR